MAFVLETADMKDRIPLVADILMAAAHADARLDGQERAAVVRLLRQVLGASALPMDLEYDLSEDAFVRQLGAALGLAEESYRDLAAVVIEEIDVEPLR